jgi:hypothetical protein
MSRNGPPLYFPPRGGRYQVAPGLSRFGKDLGGGAADQLVFPIRTYLSGCAELRRDEQQRRQLVAAIESMTPASLQYKGLAECRDDLLRWLAFAVQSEHA